MKLIPIKIKIGKLFQILKIDNDKYEKSQKSQIDIFIRIPNGNLVQINSFIKKKANNILEIKLESGISTRCSENHLIQNENGITTKIKDANFVYTINGLDKIISKEFIKKGDVYDISIPDPHLYVTPNGIIHHNTSTAFALCDGLNAEYLYINASIENSIDIIRNKVSQFAMTGSFCDGKKIVILDEMDRMMNAQDALKALIEQTESNCRFIITTNNLAKIIDPIKSRCNHIDFNFSTKDTKDLIVQYFKRVCWILDAEKITYDKKVLAEFIQKIYPDFRKTLNELQKYVIMHGSIDEKIFQSIDGTVLTNLIEELKNKKFNNVRKICNEIDTSSFFADFYKQIDTYIEDSSKPNVIMILAKYAYENALTTNQELGIVACCIELMQEAKWR